MDGFNYLAEYYDQFVGADYDKIASYIDQQIKQYLPGASYGVDLGCGSGSLTYRLADLSYDMIGVDASEAMLAQAVAKQNEANDVLFLQQDLTELDLYGAADFMVSTLDCLNYLCEFQDVVSFFRRCALFLKPGGILVFDFNTLHKYTDVLDGQNFVFENEQAFCVWENEFDGQFMYYDLTYFVKNGDRYDRFEDHQTQSYYSYDRIVNLLNSLGFDLLSVSDDYSPLKPNDRTQRIVLTVQKRRL